MASTAISASIWTLRVLDGNHLPGSENEHRLGHEGPRQGGAFGQGTARPPVVVNHGAPDTCHLQHGRELPVQRRQRTDGVVEKRQQLAL